MLHCTFFWRQQTLLKWCEKEIDVCLGFLCSPFTFFSVFRHLIKIVLFSSLLSITFFVFWIFWSMKAVHGLTCSTLKFLFCKKKKIQNVLRKLKKTTSNCSAREYLSCSLFSISSKPIRFRGESLTAPYYFWKALWVSKKERERKRRRKEK